MEKEYNKLREDLFNLRMKQTFQKKSNSQEEYLKTEKEILLTREKLKNLIKDTMLDENNKGGRKK